MENNVNTEHILWQSPDQQTEVWMQQVSGKTPEEKKQRMEFDFSADGVMEAADWLNEQYIQQKPLWDLSKKLV